MALFVGAPSEDVLDFYVDFFALYSSLSQVKSFMEKTEGKHFVVSGTPESPNVELLDGPPIGTYGSCCACWRAWVASAAYMVASGMICGAVGAAGAIVTGGVGAISGFMCGGVFWAIEKLPNFDDACK